MVLINRVNEEVVITVGMSSPHRLIKSVMENDLLVDKSMSLSLSRHGSRPDFLEMTLSACG